VGGGRGAPEFIVSTAQTPDFLLIFECKASTTHHETPDHSSPKNFAVDGALHYAAYLSKAFNVVAIAATGQTEADLKISCFLHPKDRPKAQPLTTRHGKVVDEIISLEDFIEHASYDPEVARNRTDDLMAFSRDLHDFMRDHAKLTESEKPLLVSGTLIALRNKAFAKSFSEYSPEKLQKQWLDIIKEEIEEAEIPQAKKLTMSQPYSTIAVHPELGKSTKAFPRGVLHELISRLHKKVWPFVSVYHDFDVVGQFYGEFLKYTGGDKKALGIVLTPRHIAELFTLLADLKPSSKVLDICCGTAGFLISSMMRMFRLATTEKERRHVRRNCLIGIEQQPNMYALAASNMILRGDGKANLYQGSCFDAAILRAARKHKCTVGMMNPPYSQKDEESRELVFVKTMLDCLVPGGTGIAIVPMSCAIAPNPHREELLRRHTLDAVMSMPDDLFYPVGTVTCIMVFTAKRPHAETGKKTWFGYWKNDGYIKTKHRGRIDQYNRWPAIRDHWVEMFHNRESVPGLSVKRHVTHTDEWCAEAYMETDYSTVTQADFETAVKRYVLFKHLSAVQQPAAPEEDTADTEAASV
jgi:type I restriction enzyme M protein